MGRKRAVSFTLTCHSPSPVDVFTPGYAVTASDRAEDAVSLTRNEATSAAVAPTTDGWQDYDVFADELGGSGWCFFPVQANL